MLGIRLRAVNGQYVCAENGGGGALIANRAAASTWETFVIHDLSSGVLSSGDYVQLRTHNGQWVCAENGGGSTIVANRNAAGPWETFRLGSAGGPIGTGSVVWLQASSGHYVCAEDGGASPLVANRTSVGPWEQFTAELVLLNRKLLSLGGTGWAYRTDYLNGYGMGATNQVRAVANRTPNPTTWVKFWVSWRDLQQHAGRQADNISHSWDQLNAGPPPGNPLNVLTTPLFVLDDQIAKANADGKGVILAVHHSYPTWAADGSQLSASVVAGREPWQRVPASCGNQSGWGWFIGHLMARYAVNGGVNNPGPRAGAMFGNPYGAWVNAIEVVNEPNYAIYPQAGLHLKVAEMIRTADAYAAWYRSGNIYAPAILAPGTSDIVAVTNDAYTAYDRFTRDVLTALNGPPFSTYVAWSCHTYEDTQHQVTERFRRTFDFLRDYGFSSRAAMWITEGGHEMPDVYGQTELNIQSARVSSAYDRFSALPQVYTIAQHCVNNALQPNDPFQSGLRAYNTQSGTVTEIRPVDGVWAGKPSVSTP